jgi:3-oxoacyl-[acyl-carrier protein] reductase
LLVSGITLSILKFLALIATKTTFGEMSRARSWFSVEQVDPRFWHLRTADLEEQVPARIRALAREMEKVMAKTAIVTGASRGIGRSIAERLASDGFAVAVNFAGKAYEADKVVDEIRQADGEALAIKADVSNPEDVKQLFAKSIEAFGRVDVVVNNAGIMPLSPIAKHDVETFDRVIATNLRGTFLVFAQAAQHVSEGGRIIAFSSSVLARSFPTYGPYIASKAGVEGLVPVLANELRGRGITVNAVAPGPTGTDLFLNGKTPEQIAQLSKLAPLERLGTPEDIAGVVSFLAGPDGRWVNAQILRANGGFA